jgi:D-sedoheptulose 7-phosphate isomerase
MTAFSLDSFWRDETQEHMDAARKTFDTLAPVFGQWLDACVHAVNNGNKILFFGNGGSAGDSQHLATELAVRYVKDRKPIPAVALTTDTSALTAIGNDMGFDHLFSRQIDALGNKGDVAIGITTSGNSPNVIKALWTARDKGLVTVGLTGRDGGKLRDVCDIMIVVPSDTTARIQEMHITLGQMLCGALEQSLGLV